MHIFLIIILSLLGIVQLAGMAWAWRLTADQGFGALYRLLLAVLWPLTWFISKLSIQ